MLGIHSRGPAGTETQTKPNLTRYNVFVVVIACSGSLAAGYGSSVVVVLTGQSSFYEYFNLHDDFHIARTLGVLNATFLLGMACGTITQCWISDSIGRKKAMFVAAIISTIAGALVCSSISMAMLIVSRIVQGVGLGQLIAIVPLYTVEVAPAQHRGLLVGFTAVSLAGGYALCSFVGIGAFYIESSILQLRLPLAISCLPTLFLALCIPMLCESPRYLQWRRKSNVEDVLKRLHVTSGLTDQANYSFIDRELKDIKQQLELSAEKSRSYLHLLTDRKLRRLSVLAVVLLFATQSTGILGIANYMILIYKTLGLTGVKPLVIYMALVLIGTISNLVGALVTDRIGRRTLLLIGFPATAICLFVEALLQWKFVGTENYGGNIACLLFIFFYQITYGFFLEAAQFAWVAEIFPTEMRAKGLALAWCAYFIGGITYTSSTAVAFEAIGWKMYMVWFACNIFSTLFVYFLIPETKNVPMEGLGDLFDSNDDPSPLEE